MSSPAKSPAKWSPGKLVSTTSPNKENEEQAVPTQRKALQEEAALVEALRRSAPGQRLGALCNLRKALACRLAVPIQGVLASGGAELLVAALCPSAASTSACQVEAAWCLVQLSSGSSAQTKRLVEAGAARVATDALQRPAIATSSELCSCCLQLLANVAGDDDCSFRDGLLSVDIVTVLGQLFAQMPDFTWTSLERSEVLRSFTWLMAALCRGTPAPSLEHVDPAFDFFCQVLQGTSDSEMLCGALEGLGHLLEGASQDSEARARASRLLSSGFDLLEVVSCMRAAGDWRSPLPRAALRLAGLLVGTSDARCGEAAGAAGLPKALCATLTDQLAPYQVRAEAAKVLGDLTGVSVDQVSQVFEVFQLLDLRREVPEVRRECLWTALKLLAHVPEMFRLGSQQVPGWLFLALDFDMDPSLQRAAMDLVDRARHQGALGAADEVLLGLLPKLHEYNFRA